MTTSLLEAALGEHVILVAVPAEDAGGLARHGLLAGRGILVEQDAPFGGPRLVRVGSRRVAVPRALARKICVSPADGAGEGR